MATASPTEQTATEAANLFRKNGALMVRDVFDESLIASLFEDLLSRYNRYFDAKDHPDALRVGD